MSDIVERLRDVVMPYCWGCHEYQADPACQCQTQEALNNEAADEIERLRWHEGAAAEALAANEQLGAEVVRLREVSANWEDRSREWEAHTRAWVACYEHGEPTPNWSDYHPRVKP